MPNKLTIYASILLALLTGSGLAGWLIRGWRDDSKNLASERLLRSQEAAQAESLRTAMESATKAMQAAKPTHTEIRHETTRVEYRDRVCFEPELVRMFNNAAKNLPPPSTEVPRNSP